MVNKMYIEIITAINTYLWVWYILLGIGILGISLYASWKHQSFAPITWGLIITGLIYYFRKQIAPLVFGVLNYDWQTNPLMFALTGVFTVMFFGYIALVLYNLNQSGEAIQ